MLWGGHAQKLENVINTIKNEEEKIGQFVFSFLFFSFSLLIRVLLFFFACFFHYLFINIMLFF